MKLKRELIEKLPKTDLHVHLDGSLRLSTIFELAQEQNVQLPAKNEKDLKKIVCCDKECKSLDEYLEAFNITLSVMQVKDALTRIAYELAEDSSRENIRYLEVRYSPILHLQKGLNIYEVNDAVLKGLAKAEQDFDIRTGVIICAMRHLAPSYSVELAKLAVDHRKKGVVAFDLAGGEYNNPAIKHKEAFDLVLDNNLSLTIHAGEAAGAESIHQAVHECGAHRIGHGTRLFEDEDLLNYINDHRVPLEVCLTSNLHTKAVSDIQKHPFKSYLDKGLQVTLNTDNRLISNTTLTEEYILAIKEFDLDYSDVKRIIINSFLSAFLSYKEKVNIIQMIVKDMTDLEKEYRV